MVVREEEGREEEEEFKKIWIHNPVLKTFLVGLNL